MSFGRQLLLRFPPWSIAPVFLIVRLAIVALTMFALVSSWQRAILGRLLGRTAAAATTPTAVQSFRRLLG